MEIKESCNAYRNYNILSRKLKNLEIRISWDKKILDCTMFGLLAFKNQFNLVVIQLPWYVITIPVKNEINAFRSICNSVIEKYISPKISNCSDTFEQQCSTQRSHVVQRLLLQKRALQTAFQTNQINPKGTEPTENEESQANS